MKELASGTVGAIELFVEPLALLRLVIAWLVLPLLKLMDPVGKRARIIVLTSAVELPEFTDLSLEFHLETLLALTRLLLSTSC